MTLLGVRDYRGITITDLTGTRGDCFQPAEIRPDGGQVPAFIDGKIRVCGGSSTNHCFAYDKENDAWVSEGFDVMHGESYGMCDEAASVVMSEQSWLITGGQVTFPYRY